MACLATGELSAPPTKRHQPEAVVTGHNVFEKYAIPEVLCKYVVTFFWDDPKTFGQWLQACRQNHSLCLDKMTAMKVWWDEVQSLTLSEDVRRKVFHASFSKKLDLSNNQIGKKGLVSITNAVNNGIALETLELYKNSFSLYDNETKELKKAWKAKGKRMGVNGLRLKY